jgi:hypothetical protein
MPLHNIKIIESGHFSTRRLFELGLSFGLCKRKQHWPSLETMNAFLKQGTDDGALATEIEWEPCELTQDEYRQAVANFMDGQTFKIDTGFLEWEDWISKISHEADA